MTADHNAYGTFVGPIVQGSKKFVGGRPFVVTSADRAKPWGCRRDARYFRCVLCGRKLLAGLVARWIFMNHAGSGWNGNPFVCGCCDGPDIRERLANHYTIGQRCFWWMRDR